MKKIVVLYPYHFQQSCGGAEVQISYFIQACITKGFDVHYIYIDKKKPIEKQRNVFLHPLKRKSKHKFCGQGWFLYKKEIYEYLENISPDVIYTRLGSSWMYFASVYAKKHNIKHIHALASDIDVSKHIFSKSTLYPFFNIIETYYINKSYKYISNIISQNNYQVNKLMTRFNRTSILVNQMTPFVDDSIIKKDDSKIKIVWVANFKDLKRPELFVSLAKKLSAYSDKIELFMCGRINKQYDVLLDEINEIPYLKYLGELKQKEVFDLLLKSHILINTSIYEGFSNTFVQAWMRKVVVLSMNSNPNNVITDNNIGYLTPTLEDLIDKTIYLIEHKNHLHDMSETAYKYAVDNHDIDSNMNKITDLL